MYLSRVFIRNFRSIKELDLAFAPGKNVIVGKNNSGKSNIIHAIDLVLGEFNPVRQRYENISGGDFYSTTTNREGKVENQQAEELFIWCELSRPQDEPLDFDALRDAASGYFVYKFEDDTSSNNFAQRRIEKDLIPLEDDEEIFREENRVNRGFIRPEQYEDELGQMNCFAFAFRAKRLEDGTIEKQMRFLYRENDSNDWVLAFSIPFRNELLQSAIIPSFREPSNQLRLSGSSWYVRLIRHLTQGHASKPELLEAISRVSAISSEIFSSVTEEVGKSSLDIAFPGTTLEFALNTEREEDLHMSTVVYIDDGFRSQLSQKGSGIQSVTIIGLFNYFVQNVSTIASALLCIEEPELYLHPHARRVINTRLDNFLGNNRNQVVISTHSTEFLSSVDDFSVVIVRKVSGQTTANQVNVSGLRNILVDSTQNELFFADKVILVEGYDCFLIKTIFDFLHPGELDAKNISIIKVGGKDAIPNIVGKLQELGIPVHIIADFDFLLRTNPTQNIENLGEAYFSRDYILGERGADLFRKVRLLRQQIKDASPDGFLEAKQKNQLPFDCSAILDELRACGICILDGEIEHLCKDQAVFNGTKLKLHHIFSIKGRLSAGENVRSLFDTTQLEAFLDFILSS